MVWSAPPGSICTAFQDLAVSTWEMMQHGWDYPTKVGEPTLTDIIVLSLSRWYPDEVKVFKTKNENKVGGDIDIHFVGPTTHFSIRFQAKRLLGSETTPKYSELDFEQCEDLVAHAAPSFHPMYLFYNWWPGFPQEWRFGCAIADAGAVKSALTAAPLKEAKYLSRHKPISLPWQVLVCGPGPSSPSPAASSPADVRAGCVMVADFARDRGHEPGSEILPVGQGSPWWLRSLEGDGGSDYFGVNRVRWAVVVRTKHDGKREPDGDEE